MNTMFTLRAYVCMIALLLAGTANSQGRPPGMQPPDYCDEATLAKAGRLVEEGYRCLDANDIAGALDNFDQLSGLVPGCLVGAYHSACAYARAGDHDRAFERLSWLVANEFDQIGMLENDADLGPLRDDSRFADIVTRSLENWYDNSGEFGAGLPDYSRNPPPAANEEQLEQWANQQVMHIRLQGKFWTLTETVAASIDVVARRCAAMDVIHAGEPGYNGALERVEQSFGLMSRYEPGWGGVCDLVVRQADLCEDGDADRECIEAARYFAGMALSLKYRMNDPRRLAEFEKAAALLSGIPDASAYGGGARILELVNSLDAVTHPEAALQARFRTTAEKFVGDKWTYKVVCSRFNHDAAEKLWPIRFDVPDLDGKTVALEQYRGRLLLVDFWATWCGPCRRDIPALVKLYNKYHPEGLDIVSISLDKPDQMSKRALESWIRRNRMTWRHIYEEKGWESDLKNRFYVGTIPAVYLVGPDGSLVAWGDDCRAENLEATIERVLAGRAD